MDGMATARKCEGFDKDDSLFRANNTDRGELWGVGWRREDGMVARELSE